MKAIDLFNKWVELGKDKGMEINHSDSVEYMTSIIPDRILNTKFSFLDIGCGNGWVVNSFSKIQNCILSVGIDGASNMIEKAILRDQESVYLHLDINNISEYKNTFDVVFSMEVLYYLQDPESIIEYIFKNLLNNGGFFVLGIDHYLENTASLNWPEELNVKMKTYPVSEWKMMFENVGFSNICMFQFGKTKDWEGTLVLSGEKL
tara:strand:+ start:773 stop:1387 length:615 start_codon:yes stop_codon:yes gene_type:complete